MKAEIYSLRHPETGEVRYIGKANNATKRLASHIRDSRRSNRPVNAWVRKLVAEGKKPVVTVECVCLTDDWGSVERAVIAQCRADGCRLLNLADGGDEPGCSIEVRRANAALMNARISPEARKSSGVLMNARMNANPIRVAMRRLLIEMGMNIKFMESRGKRDIAERMRQTAIKFKEAARSDRDGLFAVLLLNPRMRNVMGVELV